MIQLSLADIQRRVGGDLHRITASAAAEQAVHGVSMDSRALQPGNLFVALPGARVHGHEFVAAAHQAGAAAALVSAAQDTPLPQLVVADVALALTELARSWRDQMRVTIIGVTGSNGKTTVKEMLAAILRQALPASDWMCTAGNYNNELGLPLTLLRLQPQHRFAVIEMGCGQPGDIALLARLARPRIGIVTSIGPAHLERLGSLQGVALTKSELFAELPPDGLALYPADAEHADVLRQSARCALQSAAPDPLPADWVWQLDGQNWTLRGDGVELQTSLALPGAHNAANAALAAAAALAVGISPESVAAALAGMQTVPGRGQAMAGIAGSVIIDDSYNANPASLAAAIAALEVRYPAQERWLVLGDMAELGSTAAALHASAGRAARAAGITQLFACGPLASHAAAAFGAGGHSFADRAALQDALMARLQAGVTVLVKGSRSAGMEQLVAALRASDDSEQASAAALLKESC